jgi:uncharacterized protein YjiS (DUF1127 family)
MDVRLWSNLDQSAIARGLPLQSNARGSMTTQPLKAERAVDARAVNVRALNANTARQLGRSLLSTLLRLSETVWTWRARVRSRHDLARFSDHLLKDIGISRADVYRETSKPFWRE